MARHRDFEDSTVESRGVLGIEDYRQNSCIPIPACYGEGHELHPNLLPGHLANLAIRDQVRPGIILIAESPDCPVVADLYPGLPARAAAAAAANSSSI